MNISSSFLTEVLKEKFEKYSHSADLVEGLRLAQVAYDGLSFEDQEDLKIFIEGNDLPHSRAIIEELERRTSLKKKVADLQLELDRLVNIQFNKKLKYNVEEEINVYMDRIIILETCTMPQN
ncbi:hypothetical protein [Flammeovirga kamogawensis]|uniref:Uncharacterized protein n=1 Tax=Flammeovirga kamogawensis TaxID=373891 RepID=A0ABX8GTW3_9BACT|nr:hypothetical protein [Flammeovirga kamogawensis]MBB6460098.1 hypothetical protein [Flammeovirga kamogawensis]QWG06859.1 hypothetical protein KM029_16350 [Flammeovirga kamogawensis]TRX68681.1 hypothetical protein EO216_11345 [Flammeovirga kamogawensis]